MALTDTAIRLTKAEQSNRKLADSKGLYLLVTVSGSKLWRLSSFSSLVFRYAVATARASVDPAQPLQGALVSPVAKHHAAITDPSAFGELLRAIETYSGQPVTKLALRFTPHVYQRPGEVRKAEWSEIDFDRAL